jgi:hypothetical protein
MKKIAYLLIFALTLLGLSSCSEKEHSVVGVFDEFEQTTNGITFKLILVDPESEVTGGVFFDLENTTKSTTHTTNKEFDKENPTNAITLTGLTNKDSYKLTVKAAIGRKSVIIGEKTFVFGTGNEVTISSAEDFMAMRSDLSANYTLGSDIDFSGITFVYPFSNAYKGVFDGAGHTLSNIKISSKNADNANVSFGYVSVFGYVSTGTIKNVNITNLSLGTEEEPFTTSGTSTLRLSYVVGVLSTTGVIDNVVVDKANFYYKAVTTTTSATLFFGGIVGDSSGTVKNVKVTNSLVSINGILSAETYIGGIIGRAQNDSKLTNLYSDITINYSLFKGQKPSNNNGYISKDKNIVVHIGGVIGQNLSLVPAVGLYSLSNINIIEMNFKTNVDSTTSKHYVYVGGIIGTAKGQFKEAYYDGNISINYKKEWIEDKTIIDDPDTEEVESGVIDADANAKIYFYVGLLTGELVLEKSGIINVAGKGTINLDIEAGDNIFTNNYPLFGGKTKNTSCVVGLVESDNVVLYTYNSIDSYIPSELESKTFDEFFTSEFIKTSITIILPE